ncbi:hypothetical protein D3C80_843150 [compost metagenome]
MVHDPGRAQSHHQPEEDADPLEGIGVGAGQVGIGHRQGEQPDHHREQPPGGAYGLGVQALHPELAAFDAIEHYGQHPDEEAGDDDDQQHRYQPRHGRDHSLQHVAAQGEQGVSQPLAPGPRLRKEPQHIGEPAIGEREDQQQRQQTQQASLDIARHLAPLMGDQPPLQQQAVGEPLLDQPQPLLQQPDQAKEEGTGQQGLADGLEQIGG